MAKPFLDTGPLKKWADRLENADLDTLMTEVTRRYAQALAVVRNREVHGTSHEVVPLDGGDVALVEEATPRDPDWSRDLIYPVAIARDPMVMFIHGRNWSHETLRWFPGESQATLMVRRVRTEEVEDVTRERRRLTWPSADGPSEKNPKYQRDLLWEAMRNGSGLGDGPALAPQLAAISMKRILQGAVDDWLAGRLKPQRVSSLLADEYTAYLRSTDALVSGARPA